MRTESSASSHRGDGAGEVVCGCIPHPERQEGVGRISGCACEGVERVVGRTRKRSAGDVAKVVGFALLLIALIVGVALWL